MPRLTYKTYTMIIPAQFKGRISLTFSQSTTYIYVFEFGNLYKYKSIISSTIIISSSRNSSSSSSSS